MESKSERSRAEKWEDRKVTDLSGLSTSTQVCSRDPEDQNFPNCMPFGISSV